MALEYAELVSRYTLDAVLAFRRALDKELAGVLAAGNDVVDLEFTAGPGADIGEMHFTARYRVVPRGAP